MALIVVKSLYQRIKDGFRRRSVVTRFDEEMAFHRDQLEADYRRQGLSAEEARHAAQRDLGNAVQTRESIREQTGLPFVEEFARDLITSFRGLAKRPLFSVSVVAILAIGMGAASLVHQLAASLFLRALPVPEPRQIYSVVSDGDTQVSRATVARAADYIGQDSVGGFSAPNRVSIVFDGANRISAQARLVTGSFFAAVRLHAVAGRLPTSLDDVAGNPGRVAALSHGWAERNFGSAEAAVGKPILVNGQALTVIGVLPAQFDDISAGGRVDLWLPTALQSVLKFSGNAHAVSSDDRPNHADWCREERVAWLNILLRLDGTQIDLASAAVRQAYAVQAEEWARVIDDPREQTVLLKKQWTVSNTPNGAPQDRRQQKAFLRLLGSIVGSLLVLSCANVSGLLLVRTLSRHREFGVRVSLGAGTWRIVRLVATEAFLLCSTSGVLGLVLALWVQPLVSKTPLSWTGIVSELYLDSLAFSFAVIVLATVLSALAPILFIMRLAPSAALSGNSASLPNPGRVGRALVVGQLGLTMLLVAIAFSLGKQLQDALTRPLGFDVESVLTTSLSPEQAGITDVNTAELKTRLRMSLESVANVEQIGFASSGALAGSISRSGIHARGEKARSARGHYQSDSVSSGYLRTMGLTLLRGRYIETSDTSSSQRVAVVTASFAKELFGSLDVVGERFGFDQIPSAEDWTVVGVVADARINGVRASSPPMFFVPDTQFESPLRFIAVRVSGSPNTARQALSGAISAAEPRFSDVHWKTLQQRARDGMGDERAALSMAATVAGIALLLAAIGTSASLSYVVLTKRRELAIRLAIGASPGSLVKRVLGEAARLTLWGSGLGAVLIAAIQLLPTASTLLSNRVNLLIGLTATGTLWAVSLSAALFPAIRAARTDPLSALKSE